MTLVEIESDAQFVHRFIVQPAMWVVYAAVGVAFAPQIFGFPDMGISSWHLLGIAFGSMFVIWLGTRWFNARAHQRILRVLVDGGVSQDDAEEMVHVLDPPFWRSRG